jgi:hypothetical protein
VAVDKVQFDGERVSAGLKAVKQIPPALAILAACGSMSSDIYSLKNVSVIEAHPRQLGPVGYRLILGPFRFVNHDCNPNAQVG